MAQDLILDAKGIHAWYGSSHILHGVDLHIARGQTVGLLGRNGMGKSTLIRTLLGHVAQRSGEIHFFGVDASQSKPHAVARLGVAYVPEGRGVFPNLSVLENLQMAARPGTKGQRDWTYERVLETFPRLKERKDQLAGTMSGGEQQMLAMGRALMSRPKVLLLDEPSMGLSPIMVDKIFEVVRDVSARGVTILLVEQNASRALGIANRGYVMESGTVTMNGPAKELLNDPRVRAAYLGE